VAVAFGGAAGAGGDPHAPVASTNSNGARRSGMPRRTEPLSRGAPLPSIDRTDAIAGRRAPAAAACSRLLREGLPA
jgi:hypothetical protein